MFDLGGGRKSAEGGRGSPQTPPPAWQRRPQDDNSFRDYLLGSNQQGWSVAGAPTGDVEFSLCGSNDPTTIRVATASQPREGGNDGHHTETTRVGPVRGGQGTVTTPAHSGVQLQLGGPTQTATGPTGPYSGFKEALKRWGPSGDNTAARDLKWQRDVNGDTQKIKQFQEVVGGLQDFRAYLLMKPGSAFVTVLHSPMKFVAISEATQHPGKVCGIHWGPHGHKGPNPSRPAVAEHMEVGNEDYLFGCRGLRGTLHSGPNQEEEAMGTRSGRCA